MNKYTITFCFKNQYHYLTFDANAFTNNMIESIIGDAINDMCEEYDQWFLPTIEVGGRKYKVTFDIHNSMLLSIYELFLDSVGEEDEVLVAQNIPYTIVKIENNGKRIFELSDIV